MDRGRGLSNAGRTSRGGSGGGRCRLARTFPSPAVRAELPGSQEEPGEGELCWGDSTRPTGRAGTGPMLLCQGLARMKSRGLTWEKHKGRRLPGGKGPAQGRARAATQVDERGILLLQTTERGKRRGPGTVFIRRQSQIALKRESTRSSPDYGGRNSVPTRRKARRS